MLSVAEECRTRYEVQLQQSEEAYHSVKASHRQDLERLKEVHEEAIAVRDNEKQSMRRDLSAANKQQQNLARKVADLMDQITRLRLGHRPSQCVDKDSAKTVEAQSGQVKERASSFLRNKSGIIRETEAAVSDLSRSTSNASLSDASIFSRSQSSGNLEAAPVTTRNLERDGHQFLPRRGWSSSSGIHNGGTEVDHRVAQCELNRHEELQYLQTTGQNCSSSLTQRSKINNRSSGNFFQTMWNMLLNAELENVPVSGNRPTLCSEQDERRVTMCTPVHASNHSGSTINCSASMIEDRSHPAVSGYTSVVSHSTSAVNHSDLIVYHLAPSVKCSVSSVDHSNSTLPQRDLCQPSQDKPRLQNCSKLRTPDIPSEPKQRQHQTPNPKKNIPFACTATRLCRSSTKNPPKRPTRSPVNKSPFSPIFANRHSPNPTTAISYYEKILPMSSYDAEIERLALGEAFCAGGRFSSLSDE